MTYAPFEGDLVGYLSFMIERGIDPQFSDPKAYFELLERDLLNKSHTIIAERGSASIILARARNAPKLISKGGLEVRLDDALEGPWRIQGVNLSRLYDLRR